MSIIFLDSLSSKINEITFLEKAVNIITLINCWVKKKNTGSLDNSQRKDNRDALIVLQPNERKLKTSIKRRIVTYYYSTVRLTSINCMCSNNSLGKSPILFASFNRIVFKEMSIDILIQVWAPLPNCLFCCYLHT